MKTIEQKAKAYDNAIHRAKIALDCCGPESIATKNTVYDIFPELVESEDERIREALCKAIWNYIPYEKAQEYIAWLEKLKVFAEHGDGLYYFGNNGFTYVDNPTCDNVSWIEKQGEQKPTLPKWKYKKDDAPLSRDSLILNKYGCVVKAVSGALVSDAWVLDYDELAKLPKEEKDDNSNNVEPKFHEGEWIVHNTANIVFKIINVGSNGYEVVNRENYKKTISFDNEANYHRWAIQDAKDGDVLFQDLMGGKTFIYNGVNLDMAILYSFIISNDGEDVLPYHIGKPNTGIGNIKENKNIIYPATKEQRDVLFAKMREAGYEWDADKKEPKKIEPKFKVKYAGSEYNVLEIKESAGVIYYGIEDEPNHIDYVLPDNCEIISPIRYGMKDKGNPYPTKSAIFSEQNSAWRDDDDAYKSFAISAVEDYYDAKNPIRKSIVDWLESLKDRVQPQPKQELSESDEEEFQIAIDTLVEAGQRDSAHWLESIKQRIGG